jgi:hypothetical protein
LLMGHFLSESEFSGFRNFQNCDIVILKMLSFYEC